MAELLHGRPAVVQLTHILRHMVY